MECEIAKLCPGLAQLRTSPCEMGSIITCCAKRSPIGIPQSVPILRQLFVGWPPHRVSKEEAGGMHSHKGILTTPVQRERPSVTHLPVLQGAPSSEDMALFPLEAISTRVCLSTVRTSSYCSEASPVGRARPHRQATCTIVRGPMYPSF